MEKCCVATAKSHSRAPEKTCTFRTCMCVGALCVLAHISAYDAHTGLALFCWKPELRAQSAAGVPHPQRATVSRVLARLSCVTSARGHQLRCGMREKAPFRTSDNRRPSRARAARHFNLSSLARKRFPPRLASRAASREPRGKVVFGRRLFVLAGKQV